MPPLDPEALATALKLAIERALAPVRERLAGIEGELATVPELRERVRSLERVPEGDPLAALHHAIGELSAGVSALRERTVFSDTRDLAAVETIIAALAAVRERIAVLETRAPMPGPAGRDGADGRDGLGFDDFEETFDGERTFARRFVREGKVLKEYVYTVPFVIDRGVYKEGRTYERGDGVTWGGSFWIAQAPTREKPGDGATSWRLAVKAGRAGKDAA